MDLEKIKSGLRAEIKKRENDQYLTFQCNIRQMCKDVLAKLEEQESVIAELEKKIEIYEDLGSCKKGCPALRHNQRRVESELRKIKLKDEAIAKLEAENAALKEEHRWRKCSEELPSHDTWCLVYHEGEIDADHYTDDCNSHDRFVMYGPFVTHWMPLPKAPEETK